MPKAKTPEIDLLSKLETIELHQREIQDHLNGAECLPVPLTQAMQDIEWELRQIRYGLEDM